MNKNLSPAADFFGLLYSVENMKKFAVLGMALGGFALTGCDSLTEIDEDVLVRLNSFQIEGTAEGAVQTRASLIGNPACTPEPITLNTLLAEADNFDKVDDFLETLDINGVRFRVNNNTTPVPVGVDVLLSDPVSGNLVPVASAELAAGQTVGEWVVMPFTENGQSIIQHYLDNLSAEFLYCGSAQPDSSQVSLGFDLQMDLTVTLDLL